jgi:hypothetical protein
MFYRNVGAYLTTDMVSDYKITQWKLKTEVAGLFQTPVPHYQTARRRIPQDRNVSS